MGGLGGPLVGLGGLHRHQLPHHLVRKHTGIKTFEEYIQLLNYREYWKLIYINAS